MSDQSSRYQESRRKRRVGRGYALFITFLGDTKGLLKKTGGRGK